MAEPPLSSVYSRQHLLPPFEPRTRNSELNNGNSGVDNYKVLLETCFRVSVKYERHVLSLPNCIISTSLFSNTGHYFGLKLFNELGVTIGFHTNFDERRKNI